MVRVMVFGTFDILHPGHLDFLGRAKKLGDELVVSISRRVNAKRIKGKNPRHSEIERKKLLESVRFVDNVVIGAKTDYLAHILRLRPDIIALGYDQKHYTQGLKEKLAKRGLKVRIVRLKSYKPQIYKTSKLRDKF